MKVVLYDSIKGLGHRGEIIEVADGYARNYLIPKGKASLANSGAEAHAAAVHKSWQAKNAQDKKVAEEIADKYNDVNLSISAKVSKDGKLFGSINESMIVEVLNKETGFDFETDMVELENHIKQTGDYKVQVMPHHDVSFDVSISVIED